MTPADLRREFYQTVAGGANPWIAVFTPALQHQRAKTMDVVAESWGFLERHEALFEGDRSAARVAVLRSETTAQGYLSAQPGLGSGMGVATEKDLIATARRERTADRAALRRKCSELEAQEFRGWCYLLTRQHVPFAVIREADLAAASLARFDLVVLPNAACLSDAQLAALEAYRAAGGRVVSTFETGWYTPEGDPRPAGTGGMGVPRPRELAMFAPATFEEYAEITAAGASLAGFDAGELGAASGVRPPHRGPGGSRGPRLLPQSDRIPLPAANGRVLGAIARCPALRARAGRRSRACPGRSGCASRCRSGSAWQVPRSVGSSATRPSSKPTRPPPCRWSSARRTIPAGCFCTS